MKAAKCRGVKFWREAKLKAEEVDHAGKLDDQGEARQYVAELLNVGCTRLYWVLNS